MNTFKQRCIKLRKQDHTLDEIADITDRPRTSVYYHIQDIPLSAERRKQANAYNRRKRKEGHEEYWRKQRASFKEFDEWNEKRVFLVSHLMFDGELFSRGCHYHNRNDVLVNRVQECMQDIYEKPPKTRRQSNGVTSILYHHAPLHNFLKQKGKTLKEGVADFKPALQNAFLQAFFDDEGCMDYKPETSRRRVRGYQNNMEVLELLQKLLSNFSINSTIRENTCNEIVISRRKNLKNFQEKINFSPGVKINSDRANSVWNESENPFQNQIAPKSL